MRKATKTDKGPKPAGPYSQAIVDGDLIFVSGQGPIDPATGELIKGDVKAETQKIFDNLKAILEASGSSLDKALKLNVYLKDINDFGAMNEVYAKQFSDPPPRAHHDPGGGASDGDLRRDRVHRAKMNFDLLIRDATIHDGTGSVSRGDVGVLGDWIAAVGKADGTATRTIEAKGRVLSPGFIDIHSHADIALLRDPKEECKILQGVTTEVLTSCGLGCAPKPVPLYETVLGKPVGQWESIDDYLGQMKPSVNVAYLVAHGAVRYAVMGMEERPATPAEIKEMRKLVAGALGISTGLYYPPMTTAQPEETAALGAETGGLIAIHIRDMSRQVFEAMDEAIEICARSRVPMQISHLQAIRKNQGRAGEMLDKMRKARDRGLDVTGDVYPYDAGSTLLSAVKPDEVDDINWSRAFLCDDGTCIGTKERYFELRETYKGTYLEHNRREEEIEQFIKDPLVMVGSDGLHVGEKPHPRLWGTFPRVLHKWGLEMIPKLTSQAAQRLGLKDRGVIRERAAADLVLLSNPRDGATFEDPTRPPEGIDLVVVNGVVVAENGRHTGATPGRVLKK